MALRCHGRTAAQKGKDGMNGKPYLQFREDGSFRVLHLTDIQEGLCPKKDTMRLLRALLRCTNPDLVVLTGDQLKGYSLWFRLAGGAGVRKTMKMLTAPMEEKKIPYAITFGNHDAQCGVSNEEQAEWYRQLPYGICPKEEMGAGTFSLTVHKRDGQGALRFYLLDSGNKRIQGQYAPPADNVLDWLDNQLAKEQLPSMLFQHIPLPEYKKCGHVTFHEPVCAPEENAGEFQMLHANGKVMAVFCGHDHKNDFVGRVDGIDLGYTPSCGFASYGPGTRRGGRLLTFLEDQPGTYATKLFRYCDIVSRHTGNRLKEFCDAHVPTCWPGQEKSMREEGSL